MASPNLQELLRQMEQLKAELAAAKAAPAQPQLQPTFKTSTKGGLIAYGLGSRFPVTLYTRSQAGAPSGWRVILELAKSGELERVITAHEAGKLPIITPKTEPSSGSGRF